jgi:NAD(P)-dependent dehydrogenase (short-subunit alcohol dehydrogenase family)
MKLDFRLAESGTNIGNWSHADEEDFRYRVALGDLILEIDSANFGTNWGWIPLVDLAASLRQIAEELQHHDRTETFEFTESEAWLRFTRRGNRVIITASYSPGNAQVEYSQFVHAVERLSKRLRTELLRLNPALAKNPAFQKLLPGKNSQ